MACSMTCFSDLLTKVTSQPVFDVTGIAGTYDFDLSYAPEKQSGGAEERPSLQAALREQAGLKLEKRRMRVEILILEHAERAFAEN